jgi:hypothetical protein
VCCHFTLLYMGDKLGVSDSGEMTKSLRTKRSREQSNHNEER